MRFIALLFCAPLFGQVVQYHESYVRKEFSGICQYKVFATTRTVGNGITAFAIIDWTIQGAYSGIFEMRSGFDYAAGINPTATFLQYYSLPTYDDYTATWDSTHYISSVPGNETKSGMVLLDHCNFVAGSPPNPFEPEEDEGMICPLLLDLDGGGLALSGEAGAVWFDALGDGRFLLMNWVLPGSGDAFLVHDLDGDGLAGDGSELFGHGTAMVLEGGNAVNGFTALGQWDRLELGGNDDGYVSVEDEVWSGLLLWRDQNADGICQPGETGSLGSAGLIRLETVPRQRLLLDRHGNWQRFWAKAWSAEPRTPVSLIDVYFRVHAGLPRQRGQGE